MPARVPAAARTRARVLLLLLVMGCVYLLTSSRGTRHHVRDGGSSRRLGPQDEAVHTRNPREGDELEAPVPQAQPLAPQAPPSPPPLLSRSTPEWDQLLEQGLYHPSSGYAQVQPRNPALQEEWEFWQDRVLHEFPNGASRASTRVGAIRA